LAEEDRLDLKDNKESQARLDLKENKETLELKAKKD